MPTRERNPGEQKDTTGSEDPGIAADSADSQRARVVQSKPAAHQRDWIVVETRDRSQGSHACSLYSFGRLDEPRHTNHNCNRMSAPPEFTAEIPKKCDNCAWACVAGGHGRIKVGWS